MRSRCKDARKNTSQKAARKEKGASAKSAYHGHDCFGLKSTGFFVAFFSSSPLLLFSISPTMSGVRVRTTHECSTLPFLTYRKGATTITRRSSRMRREKLYTYVVVYHISKPLVLRARLNAKRRMFYVRVHIFLPSPSEASPETFFSILSRGYRVTGLLKWPEHCSASRVARTRVPAVTEPTVRFRHVANEKNRATENEK